MFANYSEYIFNKVKKKEKKDIVNAVILTGKYVHRRKKKKGQRGTS